MFITVPLSAPMSTPTAHSTFEFHQCCIATKWRIRASSSSAASGVDLTTLESAIANTSLRELTTLGIKNAENLAIPSFRNDVTSPHGNNYHYGETVGSGTFAFTASETGDCMACFWAADHKPPMTFSVDFDWKSGVAAKEWSKVAKKGQIEVMELELKKMYDTVASIHDEMFHLREREEEMQRLNRETNSKMQSGSGAEQPQIANLSGLFKDGHL